MNDKPITDQKLDELQALCEAATPGPWFEIDFSAPEVIGDKEPIASDISVSCSWPAPIFVANMCGGLDGFKGVGQALKDAAFIAGANPTIVLALIKRVRELEGAVTSQNRAIAEFLDAETAWNNDEINEAEYVDTLSALKPAMYEARRILKGEQPC